MATVGATFHTDVTRLLTNSSNSVGLIHVQAAHHYNMERRNERLLRVFWGQKAYWPPWTPAESCEGPSPTRHRQEPVYHPAVWRYSWFPQCHSQTAHPPLVDLPLKWPKHKWISVTVCMYPKAARGKHQGLTLISSLSSQNRPELLGIWNLWVCTFLDGLHLARPAAHVLLCLDEGGQIYCLEARDSSGNYTWCSHADFDVNNKDIWLYLYLTSYIQGWKTPFHPDSHLFENS